MLIIATQNIHKVQEIRAILNNWNWEIRALSDINPNLIIIEDGVTYEENARKKAERVLREFDWITLGEDTGLEVDALDGRPGVYSARYAGDNASYQDNIQKLLSEMRNISLENRTARFRCVCALAFSLGYRRPTQIFEGICQGFIIDKPRGNGGFGYDPIFVPQGYDKTFAELASEEKNRISHRGKALQKVKSFLSAIEAELSSLI